MGSTVLRVRRHMPVLVSPAKPTPRETKLLSDIDDQEGNRYQMPLIQFYRVRPSINGNPAKVIKQALAETLVFYYPLAGRLRELHGRKLTVDCTGEGVLFIEADADATLDELSSGNGQLQPPFAFLSEVLFDVPGSSRILHSPLLLIQFIKAMGEMIIGAYSPSIIPVWMRERFNARNPPKPTFFHLEYDEVIGTAFSLDDIVRKSLLFESFKILVLKTYFRHKYSTFDILTACLLRCCTAAFQPKPEAEVRLICPVNTRTKFNPPLPEGFYGNASAYIVAVTIAGELINNPLEYVMKLVRKTKLSRTEDYIKLVADLMVMRGRPSYTCVDDTYLVVDMTRAEFEELDIGWGKPAYGGIAKAEMEAFSGTNSFFISMKTKMEEKGVLVTIG